VGLQLGGRDVQRRGELADRRQSGLIPRLEPLDRGAIDTSALGELDLDQAFLHAPVEQRRNRRRRGSGRHVCADRSRARRLAAAGVDGNACGSGHAAIVGCA
jgi:hypothetical protein